MKWAGTTFMRIYIQKRLFKSTVSLIFHPAEDAKLIAAALLVVAVAAYPLAYLQQARAATGAVTLTATVATSLSFTTTTGSADVFGTITPGTPKFATTTLSVTTNNSAGWIVSLAGDNKNSSNHNLQLSGESSTQITDQTEWVPGAATTSAGNAVRISSLANSGDVLAFRVMTASSTNGGAFLASAWWGTTDSYADAATTLWAGIASSTVQRTIGNAGAGSYSASAHLNTVVYYLDVASSQKTGAYSAPLTFTATAN